MNSKEKRLFNHVYRTMNYVLYDNSKPFVSHLYNNEPFLYIELQQNIKDLLGTQREVTIDVCQVDIRYFAQQYINCGVSDLELNKPKEHILPHHINLFLSARLNELEFTGNIIVDDEEPFPSKEYYMARLMSLYDYHEAEKVIASKEQQDIVQFKVDFEKLFVIRQDELTDKDSVDDYIKNTIYKDIVDNHCYEVTMTKEKVLQSC